MVKGKGITVQLLEGARYLDLLAKTGKTSLKDTRRVLLAIDALKYAFDVLPNDEVDHSLERPSVLESTACDRAYRQMCLQATQHLALRETLQSIAKVRHMPGKLPATQRYLPLADVRLIPSV